MEINEHANKSFQKACDASRHFLATWACEYFLRERLTVLLLNKAEIVVFQISILPITLNFSRHLP
jgi:hypothetical protein